MGGKTGQAYPLLSHLAERGWVCVAINYRLSPRAVWPAQIADVKQALDDHRVVPGRPDDSVRAAAAHRLKLREHHRQLVRRVLGVEEDTVEAGIGKDFGD